MVSFADDETPRSVQLYDVDPVKIAAGVRCLVDDIGVDHIDLNFGCPVGKVTRKGGGAALPIHRRLFESIVRAAVRTAGAVPVTVKMRMGVDASTPTSIEAGRIAENEGAAAVALHARTAEQLYSGQADWSAIARLKEAVTSIPVLGNGDIWVAADAAAMIAETGCDGVVVGRGCLGRPWLFAQLEALLTGVPVAPDPSTAEVAAVMMRHARLLSEHMGEARAMRDFRKHIGWYLTGYPVGGDARRAAVAVTTLGELEDRLAVIAAADVALPPGTSMRRGPEGGPRRVTLPSGWLDEIDSPLAPAGDVELVSGG